MTLVFANTVQQILPIRSFNSCTSNIQPSALQQFLSFNDAMTQFQLPTSRQICTKILMCIDESLMTSFHAVHEFYYMHKNIGILVQKKATYTPAVRCFLHLSSFGQKST